MFLSRHNPVCASNVKQKQNKVGQKRQGLNVPLFTDMFCLCERNSPSGRIGGVWSLMFRQYCGYLKGQSIHVQIYESLKLTFYLVTLNISNS